MIDDHNEDRLIEEAMRALESLPVHLSRVAAISWSAKAVSEGRCVLDIISRALTKQGERHFDISMSLVALGKSAGDGSRAERVAQRRAMTPTLRLAVLQRDGHKCRSCGATQDDAKLHVDHVVSISRDGKTVMENLQTLCADCNLAKAGKTVVIPDGGAL